MVQSYCTVLWPVLVFFIVRCGLRQEVRKVSESIKYNHPLRKFVDTILRKVSWIDLNSIQTSVLCPLK